VRVELGTFYAGKDNTGPLQGISSDALHLLYFLEQGDLSEKQLHRIVESSKVLETPVGYRLLNPSIVKDVIGGKKNGIILHVVEGYHESTVWPFEQAIIHNGAKKFDLNHVAEVSSRVFPHLDSEPEYFVIKGQEIEKGGCDPQLWTVAAKKYFDCLKTKDISL